MRDSFPGHACCGGRRPRPRAFAPPDRFPARCSRRSNTSGERRSNATTFHPSLPIARSIVKPIYSDIARDAQVEGLVVVRALVDAEGRVDRVQIEQSIPLLDDGAMEAARRFRFTPARRAGRPVAVWVRLPFRFVLHGSF